MADAQQAGANYRKAHTRGGGVSGVRMTKATKLSGTTSHPLGDRSILLCSGSTAGMMAVNASHTLAPEWHRKACKPMTACGFSLA